MRTLSILLSYMFISFNSPISASIIHEFRTKQEMGRAVNFLYTNTLAGIEADGVLFDATLEARAFFHIDPAFPFLHPGGLTVYTWPGLSQNFVESGEGLSFSVSIDNVQGGTVVFDGFTSIDFDSFHPNEEGVLSLDSNPNTAVDNFFTTNLGADVVDLSSILPVSFSAISLLDGGNFNANSFRVEGLSAQFSGTPTTVSVPEPSSVVLTLTGLGFFCFTRKKWSACPSSHR